MLAGDMTDPKHPSWLRARLAKWPLLAYRLGLGPVIAGRVMVLTTKGRVTGRSRKTPLWYVRDGNQIYCISGWGPYGDWWKNLNADPSALVRIGNTSWKTRGTLIKEGPERDRILIRIIEKYGRMTRLVYHMDRLTLAAFHLDKTV